MYFEPGKIKHGLAFDPFKSCVVPRPIGWISTTSREGYDNLAPFSQFQNVTFDPPTVLFIANQRAAGGRKDSVVNAEARGEFVWNLATYDLRHAVNATSEEFEPGVDEFERAGLRKAPSRLVRPPRVAASPIQFECQYLNTVRVPGDSDVGTVDIVLGRVVAIHIADEAMTNGRIDVARIRPLARLGYYEYCAISEVFEMASAFLAQIMTVCRDHGAPISLFRAFGVRVLPGWRADDDLVYGTWQEQPLRLLVYKPAAATSPEPAPILVYIHGGGFSLGDRFENGTNLRWFADRGWLVLSIDYTLSSADRHLWDITTSQVGCAMARATTNAARFGGDPGRMSLVGSSAGGNLAINAAYLANAGRLESSCGGMVPHVSAVSALYPPVDLAVAWASRVPKISDMARQFNTYYVGGSPDQFPDRYRFVDSATHISAAAPPTLVIFGTNDHLVPPEATDEFVQQARSAGIDVESVRFPYGEHAFNLNQYGIGNQLFLGLTARFLRQHGSRPAASKPSSANNAP